MIQTVHGHDRLVEDYDGTPGINCCYLEETLLSQLVRDNRGIALQVSIKNIHMQSCYSELHGM